jgi:hypothetical protein
MRPSILAGQTQLTFNDYFKLNLDIEYILAHFGYTFRSENVVLPHIAVLNRSWYEVCRGARRSRAPRHTLLHKPFRITIVQQSYLGTTISTSACRQVCPLSA